MKSRKPSDPLSWFYQAAIHGVTDDAINKAAAQDPNVANVFKKRYWNQCPHDGENSANFLPWHRAYTYYFERILRMHTEDDTFSLPYWNYTENGNRKFPKEFGIQHLDGNPNNNSEANINPLFLASRDFYFTSYEHPFATGLPLVELSDSAVDTSLPMDCPVFFGETEREGLGGGIADEDPSTRGLLESYPHDQIHRAVGGIVTSPTGDQVVGAMAAPPTAGFDPIFSIHHSNIDRLWALWSCIPGKSWGTLPSHYWFHERPWFFYDTKGHVVNEPRKKYFDHRALGIRFKYEDLSCQPLQLPPERVELAESPPPRMQSVKLLARHPHSLAAFTATRAIVQLGGPVMDQLREPARAVKASNATGMPRLMLRLNDVRLGLVQATGFDVHLTKSPTASLGRRDKSFVGSIAMFKHDHEAKSAMGPTTAAIHGTMEQHNSQAESFDISKAITGLEGADLQGLHLVIVPYALLSLPGKSTTFLGRDFLTVGSVDFLSVQ